jgi:ribosomal protein S18 acetylase RimI-like enzyme
MNEDSYTLLERAPSPDEYLSLREAAGLKPVEREAARRGLSNSLYAISVVHDGRLIGTGRVIGDGGLYFYIQDLIVHPEFRGEGLETCIMDKLMEFLHESAPPNAFFCVRAGEEGSDFCRQFGFAPEGR